MASIRIMKGVRWRIGSINPIQITRDELTMIGVGMVYITSKRVIFKSDKRNTTLRLSSLIAFRPYSDGLVLEKATGRSPHLIIKGDVERAAAILAGVLAKA